MSQVDKIADSSVDESPSMALPRADTLPEMSDAQVHSLGKMQVNDGDFETKAVVNDDGRLDISINQCSKLLASQVCSTLKRHCKGKKECPDPTIESLPASIIGKSESEGLPPPRMNIVIHVVGSRGDVQPFVSLGKVLHEKYGHRVRLATHPTFKAFVEENGLEFFSIGGDPAELMAFMVKNPGLMPGLDSLKSGDVGQRRRGMYEIVKGCWRSCIEAGNGMDEVDYSKIHGNSPRSLDMPFIADAIIANPPSFAHIHCAERLGIPLHLMFTMPWSPTQSFPHPLTTIHSSNAEPNMTNLVSYALVEMMTWQGLGDVMNRFRTRTLGLEPVSLMWAPGMTSRLRIPFTYCWSPALIPKPEDWGDHIFVSGFYFLSLASSFTPDPKLLSFLEAGPPPVYIGFGSIVVEDPDVMTKLIFEAVKKSGVRALVSKGWGGFGADELSIPEQIFMLGNVPHDWLFKHVSAVVHHGGAGTTAAGILAGKPTVVVPFFGDQPFWGAMTARAGAGPDPVPYKHLTADSLSAALLKALTPEALTKAKILGESISKEEGAVAGAQSFHNMLDLDKHRCLVTPNRVAAARIKKTNIRLSPLAVIVLGDEGLLKSSDLKLYRPCEYDAEDGPWDPITGGASALLGTLSSLMVGIADLPVEIVLGLKATVQQKAAERALKASSPSSPASASDLTLSKQSTFESIASNTSNETSPTTINSGRSSEDVAGQEEKKFEPELISPEKRAHTIAIDTMLKPRHTHRLDPGDRTSHKAAVHAEKGLTSVASAVLRPPMDITMSIARGFHNAPKLYGDDTVRSSDKIVNFKTGITAAGREFGLGFYDGISGLLTQPFNGAKKGGVKGFLEGIGKGVSGLILKPGAAIFGLGGYTFKGIYLELQRHMGATTHSYIIAARITQGHADWETTTPEERAQIIANYLKLKEDPKMQRNGGHYGHMDLLRTLQNHPSESSLEQGESKTPHRYREDKYHEPTHSLKSHFAIPRNHSSPDLASGETERLGHRNSLRRHLPHLHKRGKESVDDSDISRSTTESDLEGIPMAKPAAVRHVLSL